MKLFNRQAFSITLTFAIVAFTLIHFTIRDSCFITSLFFYAFPLPVIIFLALLVYLLSKERIKRVSGVLMLSLFFFWFSRSYQYHSFETGEETIEVVFWNANHYRDFSDAIQENGHIPDVLVLVECHEFMRKNVRDRFPDYFVETFGTEIAILSKSPIENIQTISEMNKPDIVNFETKNLRFSIVDMPASLALARKPMLDFAFEHTKNADVVMGDFNTPLESAHFDSFKLKFQHAFTEKGKGFTETWFWNLPILSLDHFWVSKETTLLSVEKIATFQSDHSMLRMTIEE
ncbi:MAG: endonuclease/exonuclease/phosphatase family protein [Mangrovimonas sp.]|nr:endonuclease/exonuclease/phosphatase family protein [Mangrovimonas sp.]